MSPSATPGYGPYPGAGRQDGRFRFGTLFAESFRLMRAGFGPIAVLGLVASVIGSGLFLAVCGMFLTPLLVALGTLNLTGVLTSLTVALSASSLLTWLVTAQSGAMIAQLADDLAEGRPADLGAAFLATRGVLPRVLVPYLIATAGYLLALGGGMAWFQQIFRDARVDSERAALALMAALGSLVLLWLAGTVVGYVLSARWFCFLPLVGVERLSGFAALRRSWQLTRGVSGTVFAAQFVSAIAVSFVSGVVGQLASAPLGDPLAGRGGGLQDVVDGVLPVITVTVLVGALLDAVYKPFLTVMSTVVHRLRTRPSPPAWPPGSAGWGAAGYPPPGYAPQGYAGSPPYAPAPPPGWSPPYPPPAFPPMLYPPPPGGTFPGPPPSGQTS
jgi:hypothetical protein